MNTHIHMHPRTYACRHWTTCCLPTCTQCTSKYKESLATQRAPLEGVNIQWLSTWTAATGKRQRLACMSPTNRLIVLAIQKNSFLQSVGTDSSAEAGGVQCCEQMFDIQHVQFAHAELRTPTCKMRTCARHVVTAQCTAIVSAVRKHTLAAIYPQRRYLTTIGMYACMHATLLRMHAAQLRPTRCRRLLRAHNSMACITRRVTQVRGYPTTRGKAQWQYYKAPLIDRSRLSVNDCTLLDWIARATSITHTYL